RERLLHQPQQSTGVSPPRAQLIAVICLPSTRPPAVSCTRSGCPATGAALRWSHGVGFTVKVRVFEQECAPVLAATSTVCTPTSPPWKVRPKLVLCRKGQVPPVGPSLNP